MNAIRAHLKYSHLFCKKKNVCHSYCSGFRLALSWNHKSNFLSPTFWNILNEVQSAFKAIYYEKLHKNTITKCLDNA